MGVTLAGKDDLDFYCNWFSWHNLQELAYVYGWKPEGTEWENGVRKMAYNSNDGQFVTPSDAATFADALERAVGELRDDLPEGVPIVVRTPNRKHPILLTQNGVFDARKGLGDVSQVATISDDYLVEVISSGKLTKPYILGFVDFVRKADGFAIF